MFLALLLMLQQSLLPNLRHHRKQQIYFESFMDVAAGDELAEYANQTIDPILDQ